MAHIRYVLKLFIIGRTIRSENAINNLDWLLRHDLALDYDLQVIDILEQPEQAEAANILATPTLIREEPLPLRRLIGDLGDKQKVLYALDLIPGKQYNTTDWSD